MPASRAVIDAPERRTLCGKPCCNCAKCVEQKGQLNICGPCSRRPRATAMA